ncbi:MAG: serine/threonine protein kinase, partial [Deltaproteobacteria bacterium]|nr:serine/threonine protein kinase [Deltaproteobacteria bacterium]
MNLTSMGTCQTGPSDPLGTGGQLLAGALAGPWRVEGELGRGGMGTVYAVEHERIGKRAALKVAHAHALTPWFTAERFLVEARVVNQVAHPGIVDIFETGLLPDGRPYLVMERLDGVTLGQRVAQGRIGTDEVCAILLGICEPMRAAHTAGVIHRDLKLDNVFLIEGGTTAQPDVKILDWGIAKIVTSDPRNTFAEQLVGTPRYVSPEQARGGAVTSCSDVYSLGIIAYELFLEAPPFAAENAAEMLVMHLRDLPPPPRDVWPGIPLDLEALLLGMLAKDAAARPTIDEVTRRLRAVRERLAQVVTATAMLTSARGPDARSLTQRARRAGALALVALLGVATAWGVVSAAEVATPVAVVRPRDAPLPQRLMLIAPAVEAPRAPAIAPSVAPPAAV